MRWALRSEEPAPRSDAFNELLTDGCARMLTLETERLRLNRRISEMAARADDAEAAGEIRSLWARRRQIVSEVGELRRLLRELSPRREAQPV
ncbi:MAG: hypothetical protein ACJ768_15850 [Gaiellaceae bacterium]